MSSNRSDTLRALKDCYDVISSPKHESYKSFNSMSSEHSILSQHPDVQYFRSIKSKNHYNYHKFKQSAKSTPTKSKLKGSHTDPFSREQLMKRLSTFTALNWYLPYGVESEEFNELKCARNGWRCASNTSEYWVKNHLICTGCNAQLFLKFNDALSPSSVMPFHFDMEDYLEINQSLIQVYLDQIESLGHEKNCTWIYFECPLQEVYYSRPYLWKTREELINGFLRNLSSLVENGSVLRDSIEKSNLTLITGQVKEENTFIERSKTLLLDKVYGDEKEKLANLLSVTPNEFFYVALLGWCLNIQSFGNVLILLLTCTKCNKRIIINSAVGGPIQKNSVSSCTDNGIRLSASKILSPCEFPPTKLSAEHEAESLYTFQGLDQSESSIDSNEQYDLAKEHKPWCSIIHAMDGQMRTFEYLADIISNPQCDAAEEINTGTSILLIPSKRKTMEVGDAIEKLHKLRRIYLMENQK